MDLHLHVCRLGKVALTVVMATPDLSSSHCGQGQTDRWGVTIKGRQRAHGKDAVALEVEDVAGPAADALKAVVPEVRAEQVGQSGYNI